MSEDRRGKKRGHEEDDTLELCYESDGELGTLARGDASSRDGLDVESLWKSHPNFLGFGFGENLQQAPLRFRPLVTMQHCCPFCGKTCHCSIKRCKKHDAVVKEELAKGPGEPPCVYPYCEEPRKHLIRACTTLHSKCESCSRRGHGSSRCPCMPEEIEKMRRTFLRFAPHGRYTSRMCSEPAWGWSFNPVPRLRFQGKKARRFLEWDRKMGDPGLKTAAELETMANKQYFG